MNTTDSAVRITHKPTGLVVAMQDEKSQIQNRAKALQVLRSRLLKLEQDRQAAELSDARAGQVGGGGRSEKIRTYNFKENRVTDHRIGLTLYKLDKVLAGELDEVSRRAGRRRAGPAARADARASDAADHLARAARRGATRLADDAGVDDARRRTRGASSSGPAGVDGRAELALGLDRPGDRAARSRTSTAWSPAGPTGEPLQYVLGRWGFRTLDLLVDRRVLIPRPETEVVGRPRRVDARRAARTRRAVVVDLGTGLGRHRAVARRRAWPDVEVWATDASPDALAVARANLAGLGRRAAAVRLVEGDWFDALPARPARAASTSS